MRCGEKLFGHLQRQLVRGQRVVEVGPLRRGLAIVVGHDAFQVGPVLAHPNVDGPALRVVKQLDGVDFSSVDAFEVDADELLQATGAGHRVGHAVVTAEVEIVEPVGALLVARRDLVELVFHRRGEAVVDEPAEMLFQQTGDGERDPRGHQSAALLVHVAAVLDGLDDRRVRRRAADAQLLEGLDQRGLGVARRRVGGVAVGGELEGLQPLPLGEVRQPALGVVGLAAGQLVHRFHVGLEEAGERDGAPARGEHDVSAALRTTRPAGDPQAQRGAARVGHLRGHRALPDQLVEPEFVAVELATHRVRGRERLTGGPDRLVRLLGVLHLAGVLARRRRDVLLAVELARLVARRVDRRLRQRRRVGTHIGDVAVLVEPLRDAHRALRGEPQLAAGLLLQRRRHERRIRTPGVGLLLRRRHRQLRAPQSRGQLGRARLVQDHDLVGLAQLTQRVEIAAGGDPQAVDVGQPGGEGGRLGLRVGHAGVQLGDDVPVRRAAERHAVAFALHDDAGGHRLDPARRQLGRDLLPQHRADLVAVQPVQDAAGLLRVDQVDVQVTGVFGGRADRRFGDLVEDHPLDRDVRLEGFQQVPGDGFALAVTIRSQVELVDVLEQALQLADGALLLRADDVERLEVGIDVDSEPGPRLGLELRGHVGRGAGQIADVASRGLDDVAGAQVTGQFARLGRRLDNDESPTASISAADAVL